MASQRGAQQYIKSQSGPAVNRTVMLLLSMHRLLALHSIISFKPRRGPMKQASLSLLHREESWYPERLSNLSKIERQSREPKPSTWSLSCVPPPQLHPFGKTGEAGERHQEERPPNGLLELISFHHQGWTLRWGGILFSSNHDREACLCYSCGRLGWAPHLTCFKALWFGKELKEWFRNTVLVLPLMLLSTLPLSNALKSQGRISVLS